MAESVSASVKLVKKVAWDRRCGASMMVRRPLGTGGGIEAGDAARLSILKELQRSLDPFQLAKVIDRKLERLYRLANRRLSRKHERKSKPARQNRCTAAAKRLWKRRSLCELEIPSGFPLSHSPTATNILRLHIKWRDMDS